VSWKAGEAAAQLTAFEVRTCDEGVLDEAGACVSLSVAATPARMQYNVTINGLGSGRNYTLWLRAANAVGMGEFGAVPNGRANTLGAPTRCTPPFRADGVSEHALLDHETSLHLLWHPPYDQGVPILRYELEHREAAAPTSVEPLGVTLVESAADWTPAVVLTGLVPGTAYACTVRAVNALGAGEVSEPAMLTTAGEPPSLSGSAALAQAPALLSNIELPMVSLVGGAAFVLLLLAWCCVRYRIAVRCTRRVWCPPRAKAYAEDATKEEAEQEEEEPTGDADDDTAGAPSAEAEQSAAVRRYLEAEEIVAGLDDLPTLVVNPVLLQAQEQHKAWEQKQKQQMAGAATQRTRASRATGASSSASSLSGLRAGSFKRLQLSIEARDEDAGNQNVARLKKLEEFLQRQEGVAKDSVQSHHSRQIDAGRSQQTALDVAKASDPQLRKARRASLVADASSIARAHVSKSLPAPARMPPPSSSVAAAEERQTVMAASSRRTVKFRESEEPASRNEAQIEPPPASSTPEAADNQDTGQRV
jgi:hypothetical protein